MGTAKTLMTDAAAMDQHSTPDLSAAPNAWLPSVSKAEDTPSRKYLQCDGLVMVLEFRVLGSQVQLISCLKAATTFILP